MSLLLRPINFQFLPHLNQLLKHLPFIYAIYSSHICLEYYHLRRTPFNFQISFILEYNQMKWAKCVILFLRPCSISDEVNRLSWMKLPIGVLTFLHLMFAPTKHAVQTFTVSRLFFNRISYQTYFYLAANMRLNKLLRLHMRTVCFSHPWPTSSIYSFEKRDAYGDGHYVPGWCSELSLMLCLHDVNLLVFMDPHRVCSTAHSQKLKKIRRRQVCTAEFLWEKSHTLLYSSL